MTVFEAVGVFEKTSHPPFERSATTYFSRANAVLGSVKLRSWTSCQQFSFSPAFIGYTSSVQSHAAPTKRETWDA
jgi:hypothetical protein